MERRWLVGVAVAAVSVLAIACRSGVSIPSDIAQPETIGEVESAATVSGTTSTIDVLLTDGRTVRIDLGEADDLYGRQPTEPGVLLLYGTRDGAAWYASLDPAAPSPFGECFNLPDPAVDAGRFIDFPIGIRLPKADSFDDEQLARDGTYTSRYGFCVNRNGEVAQYGGT